MQLVQIVNGTRLSVYHDSRKVDAVVNGDPYVVGIAGHDYPNLIVRIPVHLAGSNENVDVSGGNVQAVYEDATGSAMDALFKARGGES